MAYLLRLVMHDAALPQSMSSTTLAGWYPGAPDDAQVAFWRAAASAPLCSAPKLWSQPIHTI